MKLDEKLETRIYDLTAVGDEAGENGDYDTQIEKYGEAWTIVPEPKSEYEDVHWILGNIAEGYYSKGDMANAKKYYLEAIAYPDGAEDSLNNLRVGQFYFEEDPVLAKKYLTKARDLSEGRIFEDEDPKYGEFVKEV